MYLFLKNFIFDAGSRNPTFLESKKAFFVVNYIPT